MAMLARNRDRLDALQHEIDLSGRNCAGKLIHLATGMRKRTISGHIGILVDSVYLATRPHPDDDRSKVIELGSLS